MMHSVLMEYHPMLGCDFHNGIVPPSPAPVPMLPHLVVAMLGWPLPFVPGASAKPNDKVFTTMMSGRPMSMGTDISQGIVHIPFVPDVLSILDTLTSGSKSEWGASTVLFKKGPAGAALLCVVNLNLNCGTFPGMTGVVMALSTVNVGMTWGDIIAGFVSAFLDCLVQTVVNLIFDGMFDTAGLGLANAILANVLSAVAQTFSPFFGSPLGWNPDYTLIGGLGGGLAGAVSTAVQQAVDNGMGAGLAAGAAAAKQAWNGYPPVKAVNDHNNNPAVPTYPTAQPAGH